MSKEILKAKNPVDLILDENNTENVVLYDAQGKTIEFEQVALIPLERTNGLYAILIPVTPMEGVNEGEGVLFEIDEENKDLQIVREDAIIDEVLTIYQKLLEWRETKKNKCLLVKGARQVGKSYIIREFGKSYESFIEINFYENPESKTIFDGDLTPTEIYKRIS